MSTGYPINDQKDYAIFLFRW